ncbi:hypothetical protein HanIR_Chr12g0587411 [Helianthus annuus]|nr:hypothetical protein HanIR_Chr12g0587411 [Helianthus annuus]
MKDNRNLLFCKSLSNGSFGSTSRVASFCDKLPLSVGERMKLRRTPPQENLPME